MSGGISATEGFLYQVYVSLEIALDILRSTDSRVRPEGSDDLEIERTVDGRPGTEHVQIKKPKQYDSGERKHEAWSFLATCDELLAPSFERLYDTADTQIWVLGDRLSDEIASLMQAGGDARGASPKEYVKAVYRLARHRSKFLSQFDENPQLQKRLTRWSPSDLPQGRDPVVHLRAEFQRLRAQHDLESEVVADLVAAVEFVDRVLPDVLARISVHGAYGEIDQLRERVVDRIAARYGIAADVARRTVLNNFRGYIDDVARQRGRWIDASDLEFELLEVLVQNKPVAEPPELPRRHLARPQMIGAWREGAYSATCVVASSGFGKSIAARELFRAIRQDLPEGALFYAELRQDHSIRDLLVGLAFRLRRRGHAGVFEAATRTDVSERALIERTADALLAVAEPVYLIVDFVNGRCDENVHTGLAELVRRLHGQGPRMYLFSRDNVLDSLSEFERPTLGVRRVDAPGLFEDQFVALGRLYGHMDESLGALHASLSGGRAAGVTLRDAVALFGLKSVAEIVDIIASTGATGAAEKADSDVFHGLPTHIRECATCLLCHWLPFTAHDAQRVFPELPVPATIHHLREAGLLLVHGDGVFEFHERVRSGLLRESRPDLTRDAHARLADHAMGLSLHAVVVYHLEEAGRSAEAHAYTRRVLFSSGRTGLVEYAREHRLFDAESLAAQALPDAPNWWAALSLLEDSDGAAAGRTLLEMVQTSGGTPNYSWLRTILGTILRIAPGLFDELLSHVLTRGKRSDSFHEALIRAAKDVGFRPLPDFDERFAQATGEKSRLVPYLLLRPTRERICVFVEYALKNGDSSNPDFLHSDAICRELIGCLPESTLHQLLIHRELGFGPLGPLLWHHRDRLVVAAHGLLRDEHASEVAQDRALRVLVYYGDRTVSQYRGLFTGKSRLIARLSAAFVGDISVLTDERARAREGARDLNDRLIALLVCAMLGDDIGCILDGDPTDGQQETRLTLLHLVITFVSNDLIPRLATKMLDSTLDMKLYIPIVCDRLSEMESRADITSLLLRILALDDLQIWPRACIPLRLHRSRRALAPLQSRLAHDLPRKLQLTVLTTILASYPGHLPGVPWPSDSEYWRATYADRLGQTVEVPWLAALAKNPSVHWAARRAAVAALGRLCQEDGDFEAIAEQILAQPMLLPHDDTHGSATEFYLELLARESQHDGLQSTGVRFLGERSQFVELFGGLYHDLAQPVINCYLNPIGANCAGVVWDFVRTNPGTLDERLNALIRALGSTMVQAAVMRGLARRGRTRLLEEVALRSIYPWMAMRASIERLNARMPPPPEWLEQMRGRTFEHEPQALSLLRIVLGRANASPHRSPTQPPRVERRVERTTAAVSRRAPRYVVAELIRRLERRERLPSQACVLEGGSREEFARLITLLHPDNDRVVCFEATDRSAMDPSYHDNRFSFRGVHPRVTANDAGWRTWLRAAVLVANDDDHYIPWLFVVEQEDQYVEHVFGCLLARGDGGRAAVLLGQSDVLFRRRMRDKDFVYPLNPILDARMVPLIERYMRHGSVQDITGLSYLAAHLDVPEVVPALGVLIRRIADYIAPTGKNHLAVEIGDPALMSLSALLRAPRLPQVSASAALLGQILRVVRDSFLLTSVVQAMARIPRCYVDIETMRMHATNFRHMNIDEFEQLDDAAYSLFRLSSPGQEDAEVGAVVIEGVELNVPGEELGGEGLGEEGVEKTSVGSPDKAGAPEAVGELQGVKDGAAGGGPAVEGGSITARALLLTFCLAFGVLTCKLGWGGW